MSTIRRYVQPGSVRLLPRAPLPAKPGGPHKRTNKVLDRKAKHKRRRLEDE
jgi:hypothetical protein